MWSRVPLDLSFGCLVMGRLYSFNGGFLRGTIGVVENFRFEAIQALWRTIGRLVQEKYSAFF